MSTDFANTLLPQWMVWVIWRQWPRVKQTILDTMQSHSDHRDEIVINDRRYIPIQLWTLLDSSNYPLTTLHLSSHHRPPSTILTKAVCQYIVSLGTQPISIRTSNFERLSTLVIKIRPKALNTNMATNNVFTWTVKWKF